MSFADKKEEGEYEERANNLFLRLKEAYDALENPRPFDTGPAFLFSITPCRRYASK